MGGAGRITAATALLGLVGCGVGESRLNPFNLLGGDRGERVVAASIARSPERPVVEQVVSASLAPTRGGVIVNATGLPETQGFWEAELVRQPSEDPSVLVLEFQVLPPPVETRVGTQPSREVLTGRRFSAQDLAGIRTIVVAGRLNQRVLRR